MLFVYLKASSQRISNDWQQDGVLRQWEIGFLMLDIRIPTKAKWIQSFYFGEFIFIVINSTDSVGIIVVVESFLL